ncbi:HU family DNA-binding protein, partial [Bacteroides fragilis]|uniref:HU family DNA-binding protein n=1 Tax=Bacteroides fragilis TaxID=817 RepID=UPI00210D1B83|nr:HU family DNA-binding protein [Bacteroides fragilis]
MLSRIFWRIVWREGKYSRGLAWGYFCVREHKACLGRNSFTGLRIQIPACKVVHFSLGNSLRGAVMKTWFNERRILSSS